jgi:uncharacterized protein YeaO (DUF488 family)
MADVRTKSRRVRSPARIAEAATRRSAVSSDSTTTFLKKEHSRERTALFRVTIMTTEQVRVNESILVSIDPDRDTFAIESSRPLWWLPELAPPADLHGRFDDGSMDWHEFSRRYSRQLREHSDRCQQVREFANGRGVAVLSHSGDSQFTVESAFAAHLRQLECEDRWNRGLMIGGYVVALRDQIVKAGGLYYARHKAWMMPDEATWRQIQSQLPGDF